MRLGEDETLPAGVVGNVARLPLAARLLNQHGAIGELEGKPRSFVLSKVIKSIPHTTGGTRALREMAFGCAMILCIESLDGTSATLNPAFIFANQFGQLRYAILVRDKSGERLHRYL